MLPGISYYSLDRFLRYRSQCSRGYLMILVIWHVICVMMPHISLWPPLTVVKWIPLPALIFLPFHLLRRTPLHYPSMLGIVVIHWGLWRVPITTILWLVVIIVVVVRWHRMWHVIVAMMMLIWIRWWRRRVTIKVVGWRWWVLLLSFLILIHARVLVGLCGWRKLVTLEWMVLVVIIRIIKLHARVVSCRVCRWSGSPESTWSEIAFIELRIFLTLTSVHSGRGGCWRAGISWITAAILGLSFVVLIL